MNSKPTILIVEDESGISNFIAAILTSNEYDILRCRKGAEAISLAASHSPDLLLLDLGLPDMDGLQVLTALRQWTEAPVIVVTARDGEAEKVRALDLGADDYITKPFGTAELLARIRTALRHRERATSGTAEGSILRVGELAVDAAKRTVTVEGEGIHLTPIEYKILLLLAKNAGKVLTREAIGREIWGPYSTEENALRVNMANIRRKIEKNPAEPRYIRTEMGVGYRMAEE